MDTSSPLKETIAKLQPLLDRMSKSTSYTKRCGVLESDPLVIDFLKKNGATQSFIAPLAAKQRYCMLSIVAIGQAGIVFNTLHAEGSVPSKLLAMLEHLLEIELFYHHIGGILGYHLTVLQHIVNHNHPKECHKDETLYLQPEGIRLADDTDRVRAAVRSGIEHTPHTAALYPVGGAGERLNLKDEKTGTPLPVALLPFLGRSLLEGLVRDLQAQEYLYYNCTGKTSITPVAMMTSAEKENDRHIYALLEAHHWFGRDPKSFFLFMQPLVPVITIEGNWSLTAPLTLNLKPCGHGAIWKLAEESGAFGWLKKEGRKQAIVRQINNPLAGLDDGLFALLGEGSEKNKAMGFLSCERVLKSEEGTNIVLETKTKEGYRYCLTNIEYPEFAEKGIDDIAATPKGVFSIFPANTNILFVSIPAIQKAIHSCPLPGPLINMKSAAPFIDEAGNLSSVQGGRLESTMQNIADEIATVFPEKLSREDLADKLETFILFNPRAKTISVTKKAFHDIEHALGTPERAFYDLLAANCGLLRECDFTLPPWPAFEEHAEKKKGMIFLYHPALGPLYSIISQKLRRGKIAEGSELQLEIAEVDIEELTLSGSLIIETKVPLGHIGEDGLLKYGKSSRCFLKRVTVENKGIDPEATCCFWKNEIVRREEVRIILGEGAEFSAEGVILKGDHHFEVPAYHRLTLTEALEEIVEPIQEPSWRWHYAFNERDEVGLSHESTAKRALQTLREVTL